MPTSQPNDADNFVFEMNQPTCRVFVSLPTNPRRESRIRIECSRTCVATHLEDRVARRVLIRSPRMTTKMFLRVSPFLFAFLALTGLEGCAANEKQGGRATPLTESAASRTTDEGDNDDQPSIADSAELDDQLRILSLDHERPSEGVYHPAFDDEAATEPAD